jgi:5-methylcytosine-specific restriction endonuclease McrA
VRTTLVLNASFEPLSTVSFRRAVLLVLAEKAEIVEEGEGEVRSAQVSLPVPAVIRLLRYVKVPYRARVALTRENLMRRDNYTCAYCGSKQASTIDHVVPRSRGGLHRWENVVAACSPCNSRKDNKLLSEIGWKLGFTPKAPTRIGWAVVGVGRYEPAWEQYLVPLGAH